jgi:cysteine synthase A
LARKHVGRFTGRSYAKPARTPSLKSPHLQTPASPEMPEFSRYYVPGAFLLGVVLTAAYNKWLSSQPVGNAISNWDFEQQEQLCSEPTQIQDLDALKKKLVNIKSAPGKYGGNIKIGIEGCIGDTPLIKIKSLSDYTGCEILAKAEVSSSVHITPFARADLSPQFLNGAGNSPKDRVALSIIEMVGRDLPRMLCVKLFD